MELLGKALHANGFVNVTYIETKDGKRYCIEADMRPNAWMGISHFLYYDPATAIANWFAKQETFADRKVVKAVAEEDIVLPFFHRMKPIEIVFNRYKLWKYIPFEDRQMMIAILYQHLFARERKIFRAIKRLQTAIFRLALPEKEDRVKLRQTLKRLLFIRCSVEQ